MINASNDMALHSWQGLHRVLESRRAETADVSESINVNFYESVTSLRQVSCSSIRERQEAHYCSPESINFLLIQKNSSTFHLEHPVFPCACDTNGTLEEGLKEVSQTGNGAPSTRWIPGFSSLNIHGIAGGEYFNSPPFSF